MQRLYINPRFSAFLIQSGLQDFDAFIAKIDDGELVAEDVGRTTHKIILGDNFFYLKCVRKSIIAPSVESLLSLRMPHHYCWREMQQVNALHTHDINVMQVAAAGEASSWGVLNCSFLLAPEVHGTSMDEQFGGAGREEQLILLSKLGTLVGRLHSSGFYAPVRMKDVIVDPQGNFVLIDRETRKPGARRVSRRKVLQGLVRTLRRQSRDGIDWDDEQLHTHLSAYLSEAPPLLKLSEPELRQLVRAG